MRRLIAAALLATLAACGQTSTDDAATAEPLAAAATVDFGDDTSRWSNDNECDDKRFIGSGMTATPLLDEDIGHDATDCRTAFQAGNLTMRNAAAASAPQALAAAPVAGGAVNFGDDNGDWSNDNECDDKRFTGPGMTSTVLLDADVGHDATDCRTAYEAGRLQLVGSGAAAPAK
ncbi:MAG: hypothetical protein ABIT10_11130 [Alteraurantiacibacter sp.]